MGREEPMKIKIEAVVEVVERNPLSLPPVYLVDYDGENWEIPVDWCTEIPEPIERGTPCLFWDGGKEPDHPVVSRYGKCIVTHERSHKTYYGEEFRHARPLTVDDLRGGAE